MHEKQGFVPKNSIAFWSPENIMGVHMKNNKNYNLGLYEKSMPHELSIKEKLIETKRAGFDFMEISVDETDEKLSRLNWSRHEREEIVRAIWETGTPILTMCLSGHRKYPLGSESEAVRQRSMEIMEDAVILARDLGVRIIQIAGYDEYYNPSTSRTREFFMENLIASVRIAARNGVILAFETMETDFLNTVGKAMNYVKLIDSPYLQVYPDIGNITNAAKSGNHSLLLDLTSGRGHIAAMHLKETVPGKFREIPYGTGHVKFEKAIKTVMELGVGLFAGEFWYTGNSDWREQLVNSHDFLSKAIRNSEKEII